MRIRQMDGLRAVAALAVVMIHVSAGRMNPVGVSCNQTARFAVPLFIMLSGYGHMHSWLQHSGQSAVQTAKRRLKRVLPAYLVWSVLYLAVDAVFGKPHAHPIKNILTGGSYVHLYYIFILVQLILLSELFCRAVERHPAVTLLLSAGLTFGMEIVLYLLTVGQLQWQFPVAPIGLFVCWPLFYNIGAWLAKSGLSDRLRLRVCLPLWALSAVLVLLALVCLVRCILGPRISDRVMAVNMIGTLTIIMVVVFVVHLGEAYLADIALIYAMISFLSVVVLCKVYTGIYRERQHEKELLGARNDNPVETLVRDEKAGERQ